MPFTDFLDQKLLTYAFGAVAWTPPATFYVGLSLSAPTQQPGASADYNFSEVSGSGYARASTANNGTDWVAVPSEPTAGYVVQNGTTVAFPASTGPWSAGASIGWFGIFDAATGGDLLAYGTLNPAFTVPSAAYVAQFSPGALTVTLD